MGGDTTGSAHVSTSDSNYVQLPYLSRAFPVKSAHGMSSLLSVIPSDKYGQLFVATAVTGAKRLTSID